MKKTSKILFIVMILFFSLILTVPSEAFAVEVGNMEELRKAVEGYTDENGTEVPPASEVTLKASFDISGQSPKTTRSTILSITNSITIDGNGNTLTAGSERSMFDIYDLSGSNVVVTFKNITLKNTAVEARCIDMRDSDAAGKVVLELEKVTLDTTGAKGGNPQPITVGGNYTADIDVVNISNSTIKAGRAGYAITTFNKSEININNTTTTGYAALYMKGKLNPRSQAPLGCNGSADSIVNITNSNITATSTSDVDTNQFAAIALEDTGITVNVSGSNITCSGKGASTLVAENFSNAVDTSKGNSITLSGSTFNNTSNVATTREFTENGVEDPYSRFINANSKLIFRDGVILNKYNVPARILNNSGASQTVVPVTKNGTMVYEIQRLNNNIAKFDGTKGTVSTDLKANGCDGAVYALNSAEVTITGGHIHGQVCPDDGFAMAVYANKSNVRITGGTFTNDLDPAKPEQADLIYVKNGANIYIEGGEFKCSTPKWTLNAKDNSPGVIYVSGGRFYKFDPSNTAVSAAGNCDVVVVDGYNVVKNGDWYEVVCAHDKSNIEGIPEKPATYLAEGTEAHYECKGNNCGKWFKDAEGKEEITDKSSIVIPKLIEVNDKEDEVVVKDEALDNAVADATANNTDVLIPLGNIGTTVSSVALPVEKLEVVAGTDKALVVETTEAVVTLDTKTLEEVVKQAGEETTITIEVKKVEENALAEKQQAVIENKEVAFVFKAEIFANGTEISKFNGGKVKVAIPFTPEENTNASDYKVFYIADDGSISEVLTQYIDGKIVVELEHFSEYALINVNKVANQGGTGSAAPAPATKDNTPKTGAASVVVAMMAIAGAGYMLTRKEER